MALSPLLRYYRAARLCDAVYCRSRYFLMMMPRLRDIYHRRQHAKYGAQALATFRRLFDAAADTLYHAGTQLSYLLGRALLRYSY